MLKAIIKFIGSVITFLIALAILDYFKADVFMYFVVGVIASVISNGIDNIVDNTTIKINK